MTVLSFLGIAIYLYITWYQPVADISPGAWTALYACLGDARSVFMGWFPVAILAWDIRDIYIYILCIYIYTYIYIYIHTETICQYHIFTTPSKDREARWIDPILNPFSHGCLENRLVNSAINPLIQPIDSWKTTYPGFPDIPKNSSTGDRFNPPNYPHAFYFVFFHVFSPCSPSHRRRRATRTCPLRVTCRSQCRCWHHMPKTGRRRWQPYSRHYWSPDRTWHLDSPMAARWILGNDSWEMCSPKMVVFRVMWLPPVIIQLLDWDVPWNKPSSY